MATLSCSPLCQFRGETNVRERLLFTLHVCSEIWIADTHAGSVGHTQCRVCYTNSKYCKASYSPNTMLSYFGFSCRRFWPQTARFCAAPAFTATKDSGESGSSSDSTTQWQPSCLDDGSYHKDWTFKENQNALIRKGSDLEYLSQHRSQAGSKMKHLAAVAAPMLRDFGS